MQESEEQIKVWLFDAGAGLALEVSSKVKAFVAEPHF
jgi:hypothetical protein